MEVDEANEPYIIRGPEATGPLSAAIVGCGGTGCNSLAEKMVSRVDIKIAINSEPKALEGLAGVEKITVSAGKSERDAKEHSRLSRVAGNETEKRLGELLDGVDITFILAGLGGYTGGWSAAMAARAARQQKSIAFCVVSEPFSVEGRAERSADQLRLLMEYADAVLVLPNDMIITEAPNLPISKAFHVMNAVLASPIELISRTIGKDDVKALKRCLKAGRVYAMDVASWDGDNPTFATVEQLGKSKWLALGERSAKSSILLSEGFLLHDDFEQLGKEFRRVVGKDALLMLGKAGSEGDGLKVTALVGY